jgi:hypothetical protein
MTNNLVWRLLVSYNVRDYPDFRPDEIINEALNEGAIDGGSGMGFGFRDHDATFETKEEVMTAWQKIIEEGMNTKHLDIHFFAAYRCCGNPIDDDCICDD